MSHAAAATSPNDAVRQYVLDVNEDRTAGEVVQILTSLLDGALHPDPDYRLPVPTLLLVGADDRVGDIASGSREWAARDPRVELVVVPGAGHASNQDNPAAFTAALAAYLDRVLQRGPDRRGVRAAACCRRRRIAASASWARLLPPMRNRPGVVDRLRRALHRA